jgi:hypothetical protein
VNGGRSAATISLLDESLSDAASETPSSPQHAVVPSPRTRRRWKRWFGVAALAAILCYLYTPTTSAVFGGRRVDVLQYTRHTSFQIDPRSGAKSREEYLRLYYYAGARGDEARAGEARLIASALFPVADSLGLPKMLLLASRPLLVRRLPGLVISRHYRFQRDTLGAWHEVTRWR